MSTDIYRSQDDAITVTQLFGGTARGIVYQVTVSAPDGSCSYHQVSQDEIFKLAQAILRAVVG